jgi:hypothetical protein
MNADPRQRGGHHDNSLDYIPRYGPASAGRVRVFLVACSAHALHDGLTDTLYVLLPIFQTALGINYAAIGVLRALYAGTMAGCRFPRPLWRAGSVRSGSLPPERQ